MASDFDAPPPGPAPGDAPTNTYAEGCKALRAALDQTPLPEDMQARVNESDIAKLGGAPYPKIASAAPVQLPQELRDLKQSAVCDLVFDIDETGAPQTPQARCTDPAFEAHALATLAAIRFEPYTLNGKALPVSGVLMPMEFCVND